MDAPIYPCSEISVSILVKIVRFAVGCRLGFASLPSQ